MLVWHYTPSYRAKLILADGFILSGQHCTPPGMERLVWFSANQTREPTATSHSAFVARLTGDPFMVRFGVPVGMATPYRKLKVPFTARRILDRKGRDRGALPSDWYAIDGPVALASVARIDWERPGGWEPVSTDALLARMSDWPAPALMGVAA